MVAKHLEGTVERRMYDVLGDAMGPDGTNLYLNGVRVDTLSFDREGTVTFEDSNGNVVAYLEVRES